MTRSTLLLAAALALAVPAARAQQTGTPEQRAAASALRICLQTKATELDDHLSDAKTIGEIVMATCSDKVRAMGELNGLTGGDLARFQSEFSTQFTPLATTYVLHGRTDKPAADPAPKPKSKAKSGAQR